MTDIFFYIFATAALAGALGVVFSRNTVNGAMCLIGTFLSMASLFVLLEAYFLAVIQVLVYAGAVMVLFLLGAGAKYLELNKVRALQEEVESSSREAVQLLLGDAWERKSRQLALTREFY